MSEAEVKTTFRQTMAAEGIATDDPIIVDGKIHRVHVMGDRKGTRNGWYVVHGEPYPVGRFGAWNRDGTHAWELTPRERLSREEQAVLEKGREEARAAQQAEIEQAQAKARKTAHYIWTHGEPAPEGHPYLCKKQIRPTGAKIHHGCLVLPLRDVDGTLHNLQFVSPRGEKRFLKGGRVSGCYLGLGSPDGRVYIAEG